MAPREGATPALPHAAARHQVFFRHLISTTTQLRGGAVGQWDRDIPRRTLEEATFERGRYAAVDDEAEEIINDDL